MYIYGIGIYIHLLGRIVTPFIMWSIENKTVFENGMYEYIII